MPGAWRKRRAVSLLRVWLLDKQEPLLRRNPKPRLSRVGKKRRSLQKVEGVWGDFSTQKTVRR
jgi:hypothetical protein